MNSKIFYTFIISFFIGIFFTSIYSFSNTSGFYLFLLIFFSIFLFFLTKKNKFPTFLILISTFVFSFSFGFIYYNIFEQNKKGDINHKINKLNQYKIIIDDEPEKKGFRTKIKATITETNSRTIMWIPNYPERKYGDMLSVSGYLQLPKNFVSENTDRIFDYKTFLQKEGIYYQLQPLSIDFIESEQGNIIKDYLFKFKNILLSKIESIIPKQEAALLGGLLLGAKEDMGKNMIEDFRRTGVVHIVVLSGYNLTLVADFFMKIFAIFGVTFSAFFGAFSIVLFAIMTGASSTIIRASVMALLVIFARATGRESETTKALFFAGFLMLLFNPMLLVFDPSFQLSFLATLGLLTLSPKIETLIPIVPKGFFDFRGILAATISTQIFVFPLLLYMMGQISIVSPIVNILILIFVPFTMFLGLLLLILSTISFSVAQLVGFFAFAFLAYDLILVRWFSKLSYSVFETSNFSFKIMFGIYILYFLLFLYWKKFKKDVHSL